MTGLADLEAAWNPQRGGGPALGSDARVYRVPSSSAEAMANLSHVCELLEAGQPVPPGLAHWFVRGAHAWRRAGGGTSLDHHLGLRQREGRLHARSKLPARDEAIRALVGTRGSVAERARRLQARVQAHRKNADPELAQIERRHGRVPGSVEQLQRILSGRTVASQRAGVSWPQAV